MTFIRDRIDRITMAWLNGMGWRLWTEEHVTIMIEAPELYCALAYGAGIA